MTDTPTEVTTVEGDALAGVSDEWEGAKQIHARIGRWAYVSVRHQLVQLAAAGKIDSKIEPTGNGDQCRRMFRLHQKEN